jgi:hypothetical protein
MATAARLLRVGPCRWSGVYLTLPGEVAPPVKPSPVPPGVSSFTFFFRPILPALADYWWVDPPLYGLGAADDSELADARDRVPTDQWVPPGLLLPAFAHYMLEDWCDCRGFRAKPADADAVRARVESGHNQLWDADLAFRNVDGAYWLMFDRDQRLVDAVVTHVAAIRGAEVGWEESGL